MIEQNQQPVAASPDEAGEMALIKTSMGDITIKLYPEIAPITVANFKQYINNKYYDGTIFHRVMDGFMIQGGGFDAEGNQKATLEPIKNEAKNGLSNKRGTLAMARTTVVDSATSQFFINLIDNNFLDYKDDANYGYAVFGEVVDGMDVVGKIAKVETGDNGMHQNWPVENVVINSIEMVE
ncbi:MAG TPA: peptidylprolyl isomerase [bacterium]|nr:peptidylprolyl isomerase [bacterium]